MYTHTYTDPFNGKIDIPRKRFSFGTSNVLYLSKCSTSFKSLCNWYFKRCQLHHYFSYAKIDFLLYICPHSYLEFKIPKHSISDHFLEWNLLSTLCVCLTNDQCGTVKWVTAKEKQQNAIKVCWEKRWFSRNQGTFSFHLSCAF